MTMLITLQPELHCWQCASDKKINNTEISNSANCGTTGVVFGSNDIRKDDQGNSSHFEEISNIFRDA